MQDLFGSDDLTNVTLPQGVASMRCYNSHPGLVIPVTALVVGQDPGQPFNVTIYGGSCFTPAVKDADIYIGFDSGMNVPRAPKPWEPVIEGPVQACYPIRDSYPPEDFDSFDRMMRWVASQLLYGKKVHVGCIGGHGRTGTFLAALVKHLNGNLDAIAYVRKNYCEKAVESKSQVQWLMKHYGINEAKGSKEYEVYHQPSAPAGRGTYQPPTSWGGVSSARSNAKAAHKFNPEYDGPATTIEAVPTTNPLNIWGGGVVMAKL